MKTREHFAAASDEAAEAAHTSAVNMTADGDIGQSLASLAFTIAAGLDAVRQAILAVATKPAGPADDSPNF